MMMGFLPGYSKLIETGVFLELIVERNAERLPLFTKESRPQA